MAAQKNLINKNNIFGNDIIPFLTEVKLVDGDNSFLKTVETLQRIGYTNNRRKELYQQCHILHKKGRYFILHYKMLNLLDGDENKITEDDILLQNAVTKLLEQWGMIKIIDPESINEVAELKTFRVLPYSERKSWKLIPNYIMSKKK